MKTLLVSGRDRPPDALRDLIKKGSTTLDEVSAPDLTTFVSRGGLGVDRIAFWAAPGDQDVRSLALAYAAAAGADRGQTIVYITPVATEPALDGLTRDEMFVWPRDEDRLKMIFMTGG
jgi:hypothetical protein